MGTRLKLLTVGLVLATAAMAGCSSTAGSSGAVGPPQIVFKSASPFDQCAKRASMNRAVSTDSHLKRARQSPKARQPAQEDSAFQETDTRQPEKGKSTSAPRAPPPTKKRHPEGVPNHPRNTKSADFPIRDPSLNQDRIANSTPRMRLRRHEVHPD